MLSKSKPALVRSAALVDRTVEFQEEPGFSQRSSAILNESTEFTLLIEELRRERGDIGAHPEQHLPLSLRGMGLRHLGYSQSNISRLGAHRVDVRDPVSAQIDADGFADELLVAVVGSDRDRTVFRARNRLRSIRDSLNGRGKRPRNLRNLTPEEEAAIWRAVSQIDVLEREARRVLGRIKDRVRRSADLRGQLASARAAGLKFA